MISAATIEYFAKDKLIFILFKYFIVENVTLLCDVLWYMYLFNEIFKSGNWGVTKDVPRYGRFSEKGSKTSKFQKLTR